MGNVTITDPKDRHTTRIEECSRLISHRRRNAALVRRYISIYGKYFSSRKLDRLHAHLRSVEGSIEELTCQHRQLQVFGRLIPGQ